MKKKGIEILIKAFEEIQKNSGENGNEPIALLIAGPGFESLYGREIKDLVNRSEARDQIFLSDMLTGPAKWGAFYNCEAFVLPSHQENFGIAVVEALACSKPVLISNKVNIWREIEKAESGLVENDTVEGTIKLLQNWLNLPADQKDKMQKNARRIFDSNFAIGPAVTRLMSNISA